MDGIDGILKELHKMGTKDLRRMADPEEPAEATPERAPKKGRLPHKAAKAEWERKRG
jgi:hypothetical protein